MNVKQVSYIALILIVCASAALMVTSSIQESATMDELAHIPSGYSYVKYFDYRLNPEHPPLIKDLAGIPLLFGDFHFPTDHTYYTDEVNGQWEMGRAFLYRSGNDADMIIQLARTGPMIVTILLIILVYIWSRHLMGPIWSLLPTAMVALSPNILAHGHYVTTDIAAAFGIIFGMYFFSRWLTLYTSADQPPRHWRYLIHASLAFGVAQLMKFSAVLLIPLFLTASLLFWFLLTLRDTRTVKAHTMRGIKIVGSTVLLMAIGTILVIWPVYAVHTANYPPEKQYSDTDYILETFGEGRDPAWESCDLSSDVTLDRRKRCIANITVWMSDKPVLRPIAQYALGVLMVIQRSAGGNTAYFMGNVDRFGWRSYFPTVFAAKEPPIGLLMLALSSILLLIAIITRIRAILAEKDGRISATAQIGIRHFPYIIMAMFIFIYWAQSISSTLNIGVRHILPTVPLMYMIASGTFSHVTRMLSDSMRGLIVAGFITIFSISPALSAPYFLSYYNVFAGGTFDGHKVAVDSNYDWGQDLKRLGMYVKKENINRIAIDYFGAGNPEYYMPGTAEAWWSSRGNPLEEDIEWFAVSISFLRGALGDDLTGERGSQDEYPWLNDPLTPDIRIGTTLYLYHLPSR